MAVSDALRTRLAAVVAGAVILGGLWVGGRAVASGSGGGAPVVAADTVRLVETTAVTPETDGVVGTPGDSALATFAGGCFWCMEPPFDDLEGVISTVSGFSGGEVEDPSYDRVSSGATRHREVVRVTYDPGRVSYTRLLQVYWHNVDPTDGGGQFCDRGYQYTTAIYVHNEEQEGLARESRGRLFRSGALGDSIVTPVEPAKPFYAAEDYHQDFYQEHPVRYKTYRTACGRDRTLERLWGEAAGH